MGFPLPLDKWFRESLREVAKEMLLGDDSKIKMVMDQSALKEWMEEGFSKNDKDFGQRLWMIVSLELWLREWF